MNKAQDEAADDINPPISDSVAGFLAPRRSTTRETVLGWALVAGPLLVVAAVGAAVVGERSRRARHR